MNEQEEFNALWVKVHYLAQDVKTLRIALWIVFVLQLGILFLQLRSIQ